jgi:hypothetical protein
VSTVCSDSKSKISIDTKTQLCIDYRHISAVLHRRSPSTSLRLHFPSHSASAEAQSNLNRFCLRLLPEVDHDTPARGAQAVPCVCPPPCRRRQPCPILDCLRSVAVARKLDRLSSSSTAHAEANPRERSVLVLLQATQLQHVATAAAAAAALWSSQQSRLRLSLRLRRWRDLHHHCVRPIAAVLQRKTLPWVRLVCSRLTVILVHLTRPRTLTDGGGAVAVASVATCKGCDKGKYLPMPGAPGPESCIDCQPHSNTVGKTGRTKNDDCICIEGYWADAGDLTCQACGRGKYKDHQGKRGTHCVDCGRGKYGTVDTAATSELTCHKCAAGKYLNTTGEAGDASCIACEHNSDTNGDTGQYQCDCKAGFGKRPWASGEACQGPKLFTRCNIVPTQPCLLTRHAFCVAAAPCDDMPWPKPADSQFPAMPAHAQPNQQCRQKNYQDMCTLQCKTGYTNSIPKATLETNNVAFICETPDKGKQPRSSHSFWQQHTNGKPMSCNSASSYHCSTTNIARHAKLTDAVVRRRRGQMWRLCSS